KRGPARGARRARQKRGPPLRRKKVGNLWWGGGWALAPRDRGPEAGMYCWMEHLVLPSVLGKRESERPEQREGLLVIRRRRRDGDVKATDPGDVVVVDLGEDELLPIPT